MTIINLSLPDWMEAELLALPVHIPTVTEQMATVIRLSRLNFEHDTELERKDHF